MSTLLRIDSSPLYGDSVTRQVTDAFVAQWTASHPDGTVLSRDLYASPIAPIDAAWVGAVRAQPDVRTPQQADVLSLSDRLISELEQADEYVFGVPMHNFGVPSALKLWIDQITRAQRTFSYGDGAPKGLLLGKKATFIVATGGPQMDAYNFVSPYLQALFGFLGVTDNTVLPVHGTMALNFGAERGPFLASHLQAAEALAAA
ncbi:MAG: FMN-dependent NADH-azoreductase [Rhodoferax sp.]|nr:FMN-dependent NADH-azoreductase [Rhodoferax sp.]